MLGGGSGDVDNLSARLQFSGVSPRSSSRSLVPMRRMNTIKESRSSVEQPAAASHPHSPSHREDEDAGGPGSLGGSSLRGGRAPVLAQRGNTLDQVDDSQHREERVEPVCPPQLPPPRGWVPESPDPREDGAGNPLLRHSSPGSQGDRDGQRGKD